MMISLTLPRGVFKKIPKYKDSQARYKYLTFAVSATVFFGERTVRSTQAVMTTLLTIIRIVRIVGIYEQS